MNLKSIWNGKYSQVVVEKSENHKILLDYMIKKVFNSNKAAFSY